MRSARERHDRKTYKFQDFGHLDLSEDATVLILAEVRRVSDSERIRALDRDFSGFAAVELSHALDLGECDEVAILETMSGLVQTSDQTFAVLDVDCELLNL